MHTTVSQSLTLDSMEKRYYKPPEDDIPRTVEVIVRAVVADYDRRNRLLSQSAVSGKTYEVYLALNAIIDSALEGVELGLRRPMREDIALHRGYDASPINYLIAKNTYYRRRYKIVHDIAANLGLI